MIGSFDQLPAAIVGRLGEIAAAEVMRADGASVISLCRIDTGGAPMLEQGAVRRDHLVLPDFQVFNLRSAPGCRFVEIKTYDRAAENKRHRCWVHGIPVRLFDHYVANEQTTGVPVHLAINELATGELRISDVPLSQLARFECQCRGGCRSTDIGRHIAGARGIREMQWYFDREDFPIVYKHADKTIARLRDEHSRRMRGHALERHGLDRFARKPARKLVADHPRDTCERCRAQFNGSRTLIIWTVEDANGNESTVCNRCYREALAATGASP